MDIRLIYYWCCWHNWSYLFLLFVILLLSNSCYTLKLLLIIVFYFLNYVIAILLILLNDGCVVQSPKSSSLHWGLSPGPSVYTTDALPLSYRGIWNFLGPDGWAPPFSFEIHGWKHLGKVKEKVQTLRCTPGALHGNREPGPLLQRKLLWH